MPPCHAGHCLLAVMTVAQSLGPSCHPVADAVSEQRSGLTEVSGAWTGRLPACWSWTCCHTGPYGRGWCLSRVWMAAGWPPGSAAAQSQHALSRKQSEKDLGSYGDRYQKGPQWRVFDVAESVMRTPCLSAAVCAVPQV